MTKKQLYLIIGSTVLVLSAIVGLVIFLRMRATSDLLPSSSTRIPSPPTSTDTGIVVDELDQKMGKEQSILDARPADSDADGLTDEEESSLGTDPQLSDTDGDGYTDYEEVKLLQSDPLVANEGDLRSRPPIQETGVSNAGEASAGQGESDSDGDGLFDEQERLMGSNPNNPDTDGDGLSDFEEVVTYGTNPVKADTDGDGYSDKDEIDQGYNPLGPGMCKNANCTP